jgi:hypothetical protein
VERRPHARVARGVEVNDGDRIRVTLAEGELECDVRRTE